MERAQAIWDALDAVARERKYLIFTEGPDIENSKQFISEIVLYKWTQFLAVEGAKVLGWCDIIPSNRNGIEHVGHLGVGIVEAERRKGLGTVLIRTSLMMLFQRGFNVWNWKCFLLYKATFRLYEKVGFNQEGRKRKARYIDGAFDGIIVMGLLKEEWSHVT